MWQLVERLHTVLRVRNSRDEMLVGAVISEELRRIADKLFEETDLVLAQRFLSTEFTGGSECLPASRCSPASTGWRLSESFAGRAAAW